MKRIVAVVTLALFFVGTSALAQEHPEHPEKKEEAKQGITLDELGDAITRFIERDAKLKGGHFLVYDVAEKKPLMLQLEKVHKDRLSSLGGGVYFACTDMRSSEGTVYDLDFFMKQTERGIETTEVAIHKKTGKARYGWKEENGVWRKVKS